MTRVFDGYGACRVVDEYEAGILLCRTVVRWGDRDRPTWFLWDTHESVAHPMTSESAARAFADDWAAEVGLTPPDSAAPPPPATAGRSL